MWVIDEKHFLKRLQVKMFAFSMTFDPFEYRISNVHETFQSIYSYKDRKTYEN